MKNSEYYAHPKSMVDEGSQIGSKVLIGAGAVVGSVEDGAVYLPARTARWHGTSDEMKLR